VIFSQGDPADSASDDLADHARRNRRHHTSTDQLPVTKFKTLGFIDMDGGLIVNRSLLSNVLHDCPVRHLGHAMRPSIRADPHRLNSQHDARLPGRR
jgi:hypothetical protein